MALFGGLAEQTEGGGIVFPIEGVYAFLKFGFAGAGGLGGNGGRSRSGSLSGVGGCCRVGGGVGSG